MAFFKIHHITKYQYNKLVKESCNEIKIYPFSHLNQQVLELELQISNLPDMFVFEDYLGNKTGSFNVLQPH